MAPLSSLLHPYSGLSRLPFQPSYSSNAAPTPSLPLYILPLRPTTLEPASPVISSLPPPLYPPHTPPPFRLFFALRPYPLERNRERERDKPPPPPFSFPARTKPSLLCFLFLRTLALCANLSRAASHSLPIAPSISVSSFPPIFLFLPPLPSHLHHHSCVFSTRRRERQGGWRPRGKFQGQSTNRGERRSLRVVSASMPDTRSFSPLNR